MIPTIGIMIGAYCCVRYIDLMCRPESAWKTEGRGDFVRVLAFFGMLATGLCMVVLTVTGR